MASDKKQCSTVTPKSNCNVNSTDTNNNSKSFHSRMKARRRDRRNFIGYSLFFVLLYVSGLITFVDPISAIFYKPSLPGSVYKSHQIFDNLWPHIHSDNSSAIQVALLTIIYFVYLSVDKDCWILN